MYIDPNRYSGRPTDDRIPQELAIYDRLEELDIPYIRVDHDHADTIEFCLEVEQVLGAKICKNLFLCTANKKKFYLVMLEGEKRFVTKEVSKKIGTSRLSFASEAYMEELLGLTPGSVTVLGLMNDREQIFHTTCGKSTTGPL